MYKFVFENVHDTASAIPTECMNWKHRIFQFNHYDLIFIKENAFESVVCKMTVILFKPQVVLTS